MARIAIVEESSDEELPSLEDLVKSKNTRVVRRDERGVSTNKTTGTGLVRNGDMKGNGRSDFEMSESGRMKGSGVKDDGRGREEGVKEVVKKKRVLNQRADNPLLRPLKASKVASSETSPDKKPRRKEKGLGENREEKDESLSLGLKKRVVSRSKSRSVTPAEEPEPVSESEKKDENLGLEKKVNSRNKSRSVTPAEESRPVSRSERIDPKGGSEEDYRDANIGAGKRTVSGTSGFSSSRTKRGQDEVVSSKEAADPTSKPTVKARLRKLVDSKPTKRPIVKSDVDEEDDEHCDSDGLSDFVVDDIESSFLEDEDSVVEMPPPPRPAPRSTRKLVQRRNLKREESFSDDLDSDFGLGKLNIKDDVSQQDSRDSLKQKDLENFTKDFSGDENASEKKSIPRKLFEDVRMEPPKRTKEASPKKKLELASSDIEDPFTLR